MYSIFVLYIYIFYTYKYIYIYLCIFSFPGVVTMAPQEVTDLNVFHTGGGFHIVKKAQLRLYLEGPGTPGTSYKEDSKSVLALVTRLILIVISYLLIPLPL